MTVAIPGATGDSRGMYRDPMIHVLTRDVRLGRALVDLCRKVDGLQIGGIAPVSAFAPERAGLVLTPAPECTTRDCAHISRTGSRVIVLATVPRDPERIAYISAGAHAYLPMEVRGHSLLDTVREAGLILRMVGEDFARS